MNFAGTDPPTPYDSGRLSGWKEIASFLGRGVRTVQRWEKTLGLPVHRVVYEKGDIVFAFKGEIEDWLRQAAGRRAMAEPKAADTDAPPRHGRWRWLIAGLGGAAVLAALAWTPWRDHAVPSGVARQLTSAPGWKSEPALSPDGGLVAYVGNEGGAVELWVVDVRGSEPLRLTHDAARERQPAWFPDGSALVYVSNRGGEADVWKIPRFGGKPTLVMTNGEDPAISPDGRRVAFSRGGEQRGSRIFVANIEEPADARALTTDQDGVFNHQQPAWSPDGTTICYAAGRDLWVVPAKGGQARRLTTAGEYDREPRWSPDGRYVYFSSFRDGSFALWRVASHGGRPTRLTSGNGPERFPSVSRDGSRLAYATYSDNTDLIVRDLVSGSEQQFGGLRDEDEPVLSPDGRAVVYFSDRQAGHLDLWYQRLSETGTPEGAPLQLTDQHGGTAQPSYSPDGRWVAYHRVVDGQRDIWIVPVPAGSPVQFTTDPALDMHPDWSPDGKEIVFVSTRSGRQNLWVAPVAEGKPAGPARQLTDGPRSEEAPAWSPDGTTIAFIVRNDRGGSEVWTVGATGGEARSLTTGARAERVAWDPTSGQLLVSGFWADDQVSIRRIDATVPGSRPSEPLAWVSAIPTLSDFSISHDGRWLAFARPNPRGDIWVLDAAPRSY
jgi:Tol biopolymer transport system component